MTTITDDDKAWVQATAYNDRSWAAARAIQGHIQTMADRSNAHVAGNVPLVLTDDDLKVAAVCLNLVAASLIFKDMEVLKLSTDRQSKPNVRTSKCNCDDAVSMAGVTIYCPDCDDRLLGWFFRARNKFRRWRQSRKKG